MFIICSLYKFLNYKHVGYIYILRLNRTLIYIKKYVGIASLKYFLFASS